jgi:hypothetical protein
MDQDFGDSLPKCTSQPTGFRSARVAVIKAALGIGGQLARLARLVIPCTSYHVTQRGNRRQDGDFTLYRDLLADAARRSGAEVWSYCLMPNHIHVIVVPPDERGLRRTFADAHRYEVRPVGVRLDKDGSELGLGRVAVAS